MKFRNFAIRLLFFSIPLNTSNDFLLTDVFPVFAICSLYLQLFSLGLLFICSFFDFFCKSKIDSFIFIFLILLTYGIFISFINSNLYYGILEFINWTILLTFFSFNRLSIYQIRNHLLFFIRVLYLILTFKFFIYFFTHVQVYGSVSHLIIMKLSCLLILPFIYYFSQFLINYSLLSLFNSFIIAFQIFYTGSVSQNFILFSFVVYLFVLQAYPRLIFKYNALLLVSFFLFMFFLTPLSFYLLNDSHRVLQFLELRSRLIDFFPFGTGLGYYSLSYDEYYKLFKPYLLELDLYNFLSKLGFVGIFFFMIITRIIFRFSFFTFVHYSEFKALSLTFLAFLINSLVQTSISSYIFPLLLVIISSVYSNLYIIKFKINSTN